MLTSALVTDEAAQQQGRRRGGSLLLLQKTKEETNMERQHLLVSFVRFTQAEEQRILEMEFKFFQHLAAREERQGEAGDGGEEEVKGTEDLDLAGNEEGEQLPPALEAARRECYAALSNNALCGYLAILQQLENYLWQHCGGGGSGGGSGQIEMEALMRKMVADDDRVRLAVLLRLPGAPSVHATFNPHNVTLMHNATSREMVHMLLRYGVAIDRRTDAGHTALHYANHVAAAEALIDLGLPVDVPSNSRSTPLHSAETPFITALLLRRGADPNALNVYNHTPLFLSATNGAWEVCWLLLMHGVRTEYAGRDGSSALGLARKVFTTVLPASRERDYARLKKTIELLEAWDRCKMEGLSHRDICLAIQERFAWLAQAAVAKEPRKAYLKALRPLPEEIIDKIVTEYVGPFTDANSRYRSTPMAVLRGRGRSGSTGAATSGSASLHTATHPTRDYTTTATAPIPRALTYRSVAGDRRNYNSPVAYRCLEQALQSMRAITLPRAVATIDIVAGLVAVLVLLLAVVLPLFSVSSSTSV